VWTTVLVLALALNFEPNRLGIIGLLILRPHPIRQLLVFLSVSFVVSSAAGLLVLLFIRRHQLLQSGSSSAVMQIAMGTLALIVAAVLFSNIPLSRSARGDVTAAASTGEGSDVASSGLTLVDNVTKRLGRLARGESMWLPAALALGIALPSVDYVALLLLISASGNPLEVQITALLVFLTIANTILLIPVMSYVFAKQRTVRAIESLRSWVLARSRRDYAVLLAVAGGLMLAVGLTHI